MRGSPISRFVAAARRWFALPRWRVLKASPNALAALLLWQADGPPATAQRPEWDDPAVIQVGAERPHATTVVYPTAAMARDGRRERSPWFKSLDGTWKFHYSPAPARRPLDFMKPELEPTDWADIRVPGNWEIQGFGMPIYSNSRYPFSYDRQNPRVPQDDNPVGSYRRTFTVPEDWQAWIQRSTRGSTAGGSVTARTAARRRSSTSQTS